MIDINWYNNFFMFTSIAICIFSAVIAIMGLLEAILEYGSLKVPAIALLISITSLVYGILAQNKQHEVVQNKYKYTIQIIKGKSYDTYYTNQYEIKNGIIYFDGNCANNFMIEKNWEE